MKHLLLSGIAALGFAGTADAALYRYDLTAELTSYIAINLNAFGDGNVDAVLPGLDCSDFGDSFSCDGSVDFADDPDAYGVPEFQTDREIAVSLIFEETQGTVTLGDDPDIRAPECSGNDFVCSFVPKKSPRSFSNVFAGSESFDFFNGDGIGFQFSANPTKFVYDDDAAYSFKRNGVQYTNSGNGSRIEYTTTSFRVTELSATAPAPVPLPASGLMLGTALIGAAWRGRRTARQNALRR